MSGGSGLNVKTASISFLVKEPKNAIDYAKYRLKSFGIGYNAEYDEEKVEDELKDYENVKREYSFIYEDDEAHDISSRIEFNFKFLTSHIIADSIDRMIDVVKDYVENNKNSIHIVTAHIIDKNRVTFEIKEITSNKILYNIISDFHRLNIMLRQNKIDEIFERCIDKIEKLREDARKNDVIESFEALSRMIENAEKSIHDANEISQTIKSIKNTITFIKRELHENMIENDVNQNKKHRGLTL